MFAPSIAITIQMLGIESIQRWASAPRTNRRQRQALHEENAERWPSAAARDRHPS
jgi:hypothetical protein